MSFDALSLACNVMTIIDFSHNFYNTFRRVYDNHPDQTAQNNATECADMVKRLQDSMNRATASPSHPVNEQLVRVAKQCLEAARTFQQEMARLAPPPKPSSSRISKIKDSLRSTVRLTWRRRHIEGLLKSLETCQRTMETSVLVDLWESEQTKSIIHGQSYKEFLGAISNQSFQITHLSDENRRLHETTRLAVAEENRETRDVVRDGLAQQRQAQISDAEVTRFVQSIRFPETNLRYNDVRDGHSESFGRLLGRTSATSATSTWDTDQESELSDDDESAHRSSSERGSQLPWYLETCRSETFGDFIKWLEEPASETSGHYWISGKPGSGKSTLMKFLYQKLAGGTVLGEPHIIVRHFFWVGPAGTESLLNSIKGMLSTLLSQLLESSAVGRDQGQPLIRGLLENMPGLRSKMSIADWGLDELQTVMTKTLGALKDTQICVLLDGLDENLPSSDQEGLLDFVRGLDHYEHVRVVVSSRREPLFEKRLLHSRQLKLETLNGIDIYQFTTSALGRSPNDVFSDELFEEVFRKIVLKSEGVFLWARLAVESVKRGIIHGNTGEEILKRLEALPNDLTELFRSIWRRLGDDQARYQTKAANIFSLLLTGSYGPLLCDTNGIISEEMDILQIALALDVERANSLIKDHSVEAIDLLRLCHDYRGLIMSHCAGLVEVGVIPIPDKYEIISSEALHPGSSCRFIHRTVAEFLRDTPEGQGIIAHRSMGSHGPHFRKLLSTLARSIAFRETRCISYSEFRKTSYITDIFVWLQQPETVKEERFTHDQEHLLISLYQQIYFQFCGDPDNPRFEKWTVTSKSRTIAPFAFHAAKFGYNKEVVSLIKRRDSTGQPVTVHAISPMRHAGLC